MNQHNCCSTHQKQIREQQKRQSRPRAPRSCARHFGTSESAQSVLSQQKLAQQFKAHLPHSTRIFIYIFFSYKFGTLRFNFAEA